ncbi:hypothetical protein CDL15_Pgr020067 [Punica granatum]|uniref:RING-type domain-containing protein n=1 Tax=Punica granatum TaxID=22663 RepID=A0A218VR01_PUNGR|nr:hypothetical protein CDL15_Pgr020067 [Punica granatum]
MSSQAARTRPVRVCRRRRMGLDLDLNSLPNEVPEVQGTQDPPQGRANQHRQPQPPVPIDVDAIDDDVLLSSPRAFAEARSKARRNRGRPAVVDVESVAAEERSTARSGHNHRSRRRRVASNQSVTNSDLCINLETSSNSKMKDSAKSSSPAPKGPTFSCPICLGTLVDGTTTKCGHIFCKSCIRAAIAAQGKCPTCRKPVATKDLIRVFLPATT